MNQLNEVYLTTYGETFTNSLIKHCKNEEVEKKKTKTEIKRERRAILRKCRDQVSDQMAETAALSVLVEDESISKYQRKRLSQSFEKPPQPKKPRSHITTSVEFDEEEVLKDLENHPSSTKINWSELARKHGLEKKNGGQVMKEFARSGRVNITRLKCRTEEPQPRIWSQKRKLPGIEIKVNNWYLRLCTHKVIVLRLLPPPLPIFIYLLYSLKI